MKKRALIFLIPILLIATSQLSVAQDNLLANPGFEDPYNADGAAGNWVRWHRESSEDQFGDCENGYHKLPKWSAERNLDDFIRDGNISQLVGNNWDTWAGGVWQTVSVTPGETYRFTFYANGRGTNARDEPSDKSLNMNIRAGIDPNGSGLWNDSDVIWGGTGSPHETWQQFTVEATATGDKMTVFTAANWGVQGVNQCRYLLEVWFDSASLVSIGPPPTNTPPPPPPATATPVPQPTNTPAPEPTATATPEEIAQVAPTAEPTADNSASLGTICVNAFADDNGNGTQEANEGYIAGVTFTVGNSDELVGQAVSTGTDQPVCFSNVTPGTPYQVSQTLPSRLEMTTAGNTTVSVEAGNTIGIQFGSRLQLADTATTDDVATSGEETAVSPTTVPATSQAAYGISDYSGLAVIALGVIVLGGLLFWLLRRQTA